MPRPSRQIDQALLQAGRRLLPELGCAGLSVRGVAEAAGVNPAMFHYHFAGKDEFLRQVLQGLYDEMYAALPPLAAADGPVLERLRALLLHLGRFARDNRQLIARVWSDAVQGQPVALAFLRTNLPRHVGVLGLLLQAAQAGGELPAAGLERQVVFLLGAVVAPMALIAPLVEQLGAPLLPVAALAGDEALQQRIDWALRALKEHA